MQPRSSAAFSMDEAELDAHHHELAARAQALLAESRLHPDHAAATLDFLDGHVARHFGAEEAFMARIGFPGLAAHREEHRLFHRRLQVVRGLFALEGASDALSLLLGALVTRWLEEHVHGSDRRIAEFAARR